MNVTQISIGRFHHFHLARQLQKHNLLDSIYTGYPRFKLKDEQGIPPEKIKTFPWIQGSHMMVRRFGVEKWEWLNWEWAWLAAQTLDKHVASRIKENSILVALSCSGLHAGKATKKKGGKYICDRGSSHIRFQNDLLLEEYERWNIPFSGIDPRAIDKEEAEYALADRITVPSEFVRKSFLAQGVPAQKISKVIYGARLERFSKNGDPEENKFVVLWVGGVSLRKGFMYLIEAFQQLKHPKKELWVIGEISPEIKPMLAQNRYDGVKFFGTVPNTKLSEIYSTANVFVLPSLEEGLAMVQGEALACGCPIISSTNSGAEDLITDGKQGYIIPIRSSSAILDSFQKFTDTPSLRSAMSEAALKRVQEMGGWDSYGENYVRVIKSL